MCTRDFFSDLHLKKKIVILEQISINNYFRYGSITLFKIYLETTLINVFE